MKQCPACQESFDNELNFCDIDGTPLVDETALLRAALQRPAGIGALIKQNGRLSLSSAAQTIVIGILIGIVLCLVVYVVSLTRVQNAEPRSQNKSTSAKQQFAPPRSTQVASALTPEPTPAPSVDEPVPDERTPETTASPVASPPLLNTGPISTGGKQSGERGRAVIKLKDGASIEVDAAWEEGQGVWYRRGSVVSFVEHDRVEAITGPVRPSPPSNDPVKP